MEITDVIKTTFSGTNGVSSVGTDKSDSKSNDFNSYIDKTYSLDDIFNMAADRYGISRDLLKSVAMTESCFDETAVSSCGAQGFMQLMPGTASSMGVEDSTDPVQNIMGGAKLLSQLLDKYNGDVSLALAGYNGGTGNVAKYGGVPSFCEGYVSKVTSYINSGVTVPSKTVTINMSNGTSSITGSKANSVYTGTAATANKAMSTQQAAPADTSKSSKAPVFVAPVSTSKESATILTSSSPLSDTMNNQMLEAFKNYTDYMRILELLSSSTENNDDDDESRSF